MEKSMTILKIILLSLLIVFLIGIILIFMNKNFKFGSNATLIYDKNIEEKFNKIDIYNKSLDIKFIKGNDKYVNVPFNGKYVNKLLKPSFPKLL